MYDADYWARRCEQARNQLAAVTAERDALAEQVKKQAKRISTLDSLILIKACTTCEGVAEALGIGIMMNPVPVLKERLAAEREARALLARSEMEASVLRNQVDALAAQLAALKVDRDLHERRAEHFQDEFQRVMKEGWARIAQLAALKKRVADAERGVLPTGARIALLRLEDGE